jgi:phosphopantothenoylcysteine decarboxylase/phosphopantothenate--cysteine ligase
MVKKHINLIVTGSSQADKALELYQLLKTEFDINVIVSEKRETLCAFSRWRLSSMINYMTPTNMKLAMKLIVLFFRTNVALNLVYPATVDFIAKITHGIANDLPTTLFAIAKRNGANFNISRSSYELWEKSVFTNEMFKSFTIQIQWLKFMTPFMVSSRMVKKVMVVFMIHKIPLTKLNESWNTMIENNSFIFRSLIMKWDFFFV